MKYIKASDKLPNVEIDDLPLKYKGKTYIGKFHGPNSPYFSFPFGAIGINNIEPWLLKDGESYYDSEQLKDVEWLGDETESEEENFVYAIHEGSIHEGGSVGEIYSTAEKAIKFVLMIVEEKNKQTYNIHGPKSWTREEYDSEESYIKDKVRIEKDYKERWEFKEKTYNFPTPHLVKCWQNCIDEIVIYKYPLL